MDIRVSWRHNPIDFWQCLRHVLMPPVSTLPEKEEASACTSKDLFVSGFIKIPLSLVAMRYFAIYLIASACDSFGFDEKRAPIWWVRSWSLFKEVQFPNDCWSIIKISLEWCTVEIPMQNFRWWCWSWSRLIFCCSYTCSTSLIIWSVNAARARLVHFLFGSK